MHFLFSNKKLKNVVNTNKFRIILNKLFVIKKSLSSKNTLQRFLILIRCYSLFFWLLHLSYWLGYFSWKHIKTKLRNGNDHRLIQSPREISFEKQESTFTFL